jgi:N-acetylmuramoyl-L-alanine amidase
MFFLSKLFKISILLWLLFGFQQLVHAQIRTVVLDPGHGGKDAGAHGAAGILEKTCNLKIVLALGKMIKENYPEVKVIYTRKTDVFIPLNERSDIANRNKADLFISVHCNAMDVKKYPRLESYSGTETYVMGLHKGEANLDVAKRENAAILQEADYRKKYNGFDPNSPLSHIMMANYQNAFLKNSLRFAERVERAFAKFADRTSRGVKQAGFIVLWTTAMPSVLVESGFLSNRKEELYLGSEEGQEAIANAVYKAFSKYKSEMEKE